MTIATQTAVNQAQGKTVRRVLRVEHIQKTVAKHFRVRVADLLSKRRTRPLVRPRQLAMALARELTDYSLPEIGDAFRRDHTTVLHACRVINKRRVTQARMNEDYLDLLRALDGMITKRKPRRDRGQF